MLKECAPCAFRDAAQFAFSKFATAQLVCPHLEEGCTLLRRDQSRPYAGSLGSVTQGKRRSSMWRPL